MAAPLWCIAQSLCIMGWNMSWMFCLYRATLFSSHEICQVCLSSAFLENYNTLNQILLLIPVTHESGFYLQWKSMCHVVLTEERVWGSFEILCQMVALSWFVPSDFFSFSRSDCVAICQSTAIYTNLHSEAGLLPELFMEHTSSL